MLKSCEAFFVYTHLNMANLIPFTKRFESSENLVDYTFRIYTESTLSHFYHLERIALTIN